MKEADALAAATRQMAAKTHALQSANMAEMARLLKMDAATGRRMAFPPVLGPLLKRIRPGGASQPAAPPSVAVASTAALPPAAQTAKAAPLSQEEGSVPALSGTGREQALVSQSSGASQITVLEPGRLATPEPLVSGITISHQDVPGLSSQAGQGQPPPVPLTSQQVSRPLVAPYAVQAHTAPPQAVFHQGSHTVHPSPAASAQLPHQHQPTELDAQRTQPSVPTGVQQRAPGPAHPTVQQLRALPPSMQAKVLALLSTASTAASAKPSEPVSGGAVPPSTFLRQALSALQSAPPTLTLAQFVEVTKAKAAAHLPASGTAIVPGLPVAPQPGVQAPSSATPRAATSRAEGPRAGLVLAPHETLVTIRLGSSKDAKLEMTAVHSSCNNPSTQSKPPAICS